MLQATFYASLDTAYARNGEFFSGRDILDRKFAWGLYLELYQNSVTPKLRGENLAFTPLHPHRPKKPWEEQVPDGGILRATFRETGVGMREGLVVRMEPTDPEIRLAKKRARRHLQKTPDLLRLRKHWLQARGPHVETAKMEYLAGLARSFGFEQVLSTEKTSNVNRNPDLFLIHRFLKEILWDRFAKVLQGLVREEARRTQ